MQPRMLVTFDEQLNPLQVSVRVGQVSISIYIFFMIKHCIDWKNEIKINFSLNLKVSLKFFLIAIN